LKDMAIWHNKRFARKLFLVPDNIPTLQGLGCRV
jgi:hypothetical protein